MSKPRKQGMRQRYVPNNKADFSRKRLKWRRSEFTDRHEEVCADRRERREMEQLRRMKEATGEQHYASDKEREMMEDLRRLLNLGRISDG